MRRPSGLTVTESHRILMPDETVDHATGFEVPDHHGVVLGPRDDASAVGAHLHGPHPTLMAAEPVDYVPVSRSQTATVLSRDPETMRRPSGLTATEFTQLDAR